MSEITTGPVQVIDVLKRLTRVADENDDCFQFNCELSLKGNGVQYRFTVTEAAEGHEFVGGSGRTLEEAVRIADGDMSSACREWGYSDVPRQ